jgi:lysozyme family protein
MITQATISSVILGILEAESSKYTNDPSDRGGPTKYGVTLNTLRGFPAMGHATEEDVKNLTQSQAIQIYAESYAAPYTALSNYTIFKFIVNGAVQHGVGGMGRIIQKALGVQADGILGPGSWKELLNQERGDPTALLGDLIAERCKYYAAIISDSESQRKYAAGWFNRIGKDLS